MPALVLIALIATWSFYNPDNQVHALIDDGNALMATGLYAEARKTFERAIALDSRSSAAAFGAKIAALGEGLQSESPNFDVLNVELDALLRQAPQAAILVMFDGDRSYRMQDRAKAEMRYNQAAQLDPKLAEAHHRLGVLSEENGELEGARRHYSEALARFPETPHYQGNIAYTWLEEHNFGKAIEEYRKANRYILGALEGAQALWGKQQYDEARDWQRNALRWINDSTTLHRPSNQLPWIVRDSSSSGVRIASDNEKRCYAQLSLAATRYLLSQNEAQREIDCSEPSGHIRRAVSFGLQSYVEAYSSPQIAARSREFRGTHLGVTASSRPSRQFVLSRGMAISPISDGGGG